MHTSLNLFPWREELLALHKQRFYIFIVISNILVITGLFFSYLSLLEQQNDYLTKSREWEAQIAIDKATVKALKDIEQKQLDATNRIKTFQVYQQQQGLLEQLIDAISYLVPDGVYIYQLIQKELHIELAGYSDNIERLDLLLRRMETTEEFDSVNITSINSMGEAKTTDALAVGVPIEKDNKQTVDVVVENTAVNIRTVPTEQTISAEKGVSQAFTLTFKFEPKIDGRF